MRRRKKLFVVAEVCSSESLSLTAEAVRLASLTGYDPCVLVITAENAEQFFMAGAVDVWIMYREGEAFCSDDSAIAHCLAEFFIQISVEIVLFNATIRLKAIAPAVAAELQTGLTADCTALFIDEKGLLVQTRPAYGSHLIAEIICEYKRPQMASVRPGIFPEAYLDEYRQGKVKTLRFYEKSRIIRKTFSAFEGVLSLQNAGIIFAAGKGIGSREGFKQLSETAAAVGAAVAASRGAVDMAYAPYSCQVGQTGVIVKPKLYIAVGISGAVQHLTGMSNAEKVAAINIDPNAAIFRYADYGIVGDWRTVLEIFLKEYKSYSKEKKL